MKANRPQRKKITAGYYEYPSSRPTLLDYYQGLMRKVWLLIGINPDRVHGLDEFFSILTFCTYFITFFSALFFSYTSYTGKFNKAEKSQFNVSVVPQYKQQVKDMLCQDAIQVNSQAHFNFLNSEIENTDMKVVFQSNVPMLDISQFYDYLIAFPRQITPFSKQGYRVLAGAVNAISCPVQYKNEDIEELYNILTKSKSKILFGFGETTEQIVTAAKQNFDFAQENVIQILASKGGSHLVIPSLQNQDDLSRSNQKMLGRKLLQGSMAEFYVYGRFITKLLPKRADFNDSKYGTMNDQVLTITMMNGQDGDVVKIPTHLQHLNHSAALETRLLELSQNVYLQLEQLIQDIEEIKDQDAYKNSKQLKSSVEAIIPFYGRISISRPVLLLVTYALTLILAANMNIRHRRFRMDFLKYVIHNYKLQLVIFAISVVLQGITVILGYLVLNLAPQTFNTDNDAFFRMSGISVCIATFIVMQLSGQQYHEINPEIPHKQLIQLSDYIRKQQTDTTFRFQYNIAIQLINLYMCIISGSNLGVIRLFLVIFNFVGLFFVETLMSKKIIKRPWTVHAVFCLTSTFPSIGYLYTQVLATQNSVVVNQSGVISFLIGQILMNCHFLTLILQWTRSIFQICKGKLLLSISIALTFMFYTSQAYKDFSYIEMNTGLQNKQKILPTMRINHIGLLLCDRNSLSCDVWVGNSKVSKQIQLSLNKLGATNDQDEQHNMYFTMFNNLVTVTIKSHTDEKYTISMSSGKLFITQQPEGEYQLMRTLIDSPFTFNSDIRVFIK